MYKCLKENGYNNNVIIENTDTSAQVILGRVNRKILDILQENIENIYDITTQEWDLDITDDQASRLVNLTLTMNKSNSSAVKPKKTNIDAMDVLLGLASY